LLHVGSGEQPAPADQAPDLNIFQHILKGALRHAQVLGDLVHGVKRREVRHGQRSPLKAGKKVAATPPFPA
jgi:hypothetical protein